MRAVLSLLLLALPAIAACDGDESGRTGPVALPADPDTVVVRLDEPTGRGGSSPLVITAGGTVYRTGTSGPAGFAAAAPPPVPADYTVSELTAAGMGEIFATADELGLLAPPPDYPEPDITDSGSTSVLLVTADGRFAHSAYALDGANDESGARQRLAEYVEWLRSLDGTVGDELSRRRPFEPTTYSVWVDWPTSDDGDAQEWPLTDPLPDVGRCVAVPAADLAEVGPGAGAVDVSQGGTTYAVRLVPVLPVEEPCG